MMTTCINALIFANSMRIYLFAILTLAYGCATQDPRVVTMQQSLERMQKDSIAFEKRIRSLSDENNELTNKCATIEQSYNARISVLKDSLVLKDSEIQSKQNQVEDIYLRKDQERESYNQLVDAVKNGFYTLSVYGVHATHNCSETIIEVPSFLVFVDHTAKFESTYSQVFKAVQQALAKNTDLELNIVCTMDSMPPSNKGKSEGNLMLASMRANTIMRTLIKEYNIQDLRVRASSAQAMEGGAGQKNRIVFVFRSKLMPCIH